MSLTNVTIQPSSISTALLVHHGPGIIGREHLHAQHTLLWQLRITHAHAHWSGRANEPIRILASCQYRSALANTASDEHTLYAQLERAPWHTHGSSRNHVIATILPRLVTHKNHNFIQLHGGYTHNRAIPLFDGIDTLCPTWKHAVAAINKALARTNSIHSHKHGVRGLSAHEYPTLFYDTFTTFKEHALHHPLT